ncbi:MAG: hypothetical protein LBP53_03020 [Candidatus Peribacteria bacterium]|jgi:hypothetical protein|nr:hypothetical protein [Candidatus Peribacteria bacterium]
MQQLSLPFDYKEPLKKEFTPEDMIYISEIKEGNFRHLHCLSCSQDTLFQTLYWDKEIDIHLRSSFRRQYRQTLYNEGRFSVLQNVLRV